MSTPSRSGLSGAKPGAGRETRRRPAAERAAGRALVRAERTIPPTLGPRAVQRLLIRRGLSPGEAANLAAYLTGLRPSGDPWTLRQIQQLMFLRWLDTAGRLPH